jgi:very-short-patch-repair endonuclease
MGWLDSQRAWSGEILTRHQIQHILNNQKALRSKRTPAETAFQKMIDKLHYHLPIKAKRILRYTREKLFAITAEQYFFGDFYFKTFKLLVEIDGGQHRQHMGRERDRWRTNLLSAHGITVIRFRNEEIEAWPWQEVQRRFLDAVFAVPGCSRTKTTLRNALTAEGREYAL